MAEINTCHDLAPSGSLLHPGSNDSVVKGSPPPRDWSHRPCVAQPAHVGEGHPSTPGLSSHPSLG